MHRESDPAYQVIFEVGELLSTFVLPEGIPFRARETCPATLANNIDKTAFERAIRAGRGKAIWDVGTCELIEGNLRKGYLLMFFNGERLRGEWTLFRTTPDEWHISNGVREWSESAPFTAKRTAARQGTTNVGAPLLADFARSGRARPVQSPRVKPRAGAITASSQKRKQVANLMTWRRSRKRRPRSRRRWNVSWCHPRRKGMAGSMN